MAGDFREEELIFMMKKVGLNLTSQLEANLKNSAVSGIQVYFMVYILRHHPEGTYLTELYHETGVSKSTLSALVKKLRKTGYISFQENPDDIRKKKLLPTEKLKEEGNEFLQKADRMETEICSVFDSQERKQLWELERKLLIHLTEMEHSQMKKDGRLLYSEKSITAAGRV